MKSLGYIVYFAAFVVVCHVSVALVKWAFDYLYGG